MKLTRFLLPRLFCLGNVSSRKSFCDCCDDNVDDDDVPRDEALWTTVICVGTAEELIFKTNFSVFFIFSFLFKQFNCMIFFKGIEDCFYFTLLYFCVLFLF